MKDLLSFGEFYVSDFLKEGEEPRGGKHELKLVLDDNDVVRLATTVPVDKMFGKYYYRSGTNTTMRKELKNVVDSILDAYKLKEGEIWLDIASNEGTLLSYLSKDLIRIGIDPADDSYKIEAEKHANLIIQDYFSAKAFKESKYGNLKSKVITAIAVFYDIEDPDKFLQDVKETLDENGLFVVQLSYTPLMLKQLAFDNILSEHVYYYSFFNLKKIFEKNGFKILDCQLNACNGGSFRVFCQKREGDERLFGDQPYRDVARIRMESLLEYEKTLGLNCVEVWKNFYSQINYLRKQTVSFIRKVRKQGKRVFALGASTKGNTLLQYFGLDNNDIEAIADRNPLKVGLRTPGSNIPICSEEYFREQQPDYALVLIWPFISEIMEREEGYLRKGGQLIVPIPKFEILGYK